MGEREKGWHEAKGHRGNRIQGHCSEDTASVQEEPAPPTEPSGSCLTFPLILILKVLEAAEDKIRYAKKGKCTEKLKVDPLD